EFFLLEAGLHVIAAVHRAVARHDDHGNRRVVLMDLLRKFQTVHAFHAEVGDQDVELFPLELLNRVLRVVGAHCAVTLHLEDFTTQARQHFVVVNKQNCFHRNFTRRAEIGTLRTLYCPQCWFLFWPEKMPDNEYLPANPTLISEWEPLTLRPFS